MSVEPEHLVPLAAARRPDGVLARRLGTWWVPWAGTGPVLLLGGRQPAGPGDSVGIVSGRPGPRRDST